jgi:hypothetical protein
VSLSPSHEAVAALLRDLGPQLRRGAAAAAADQDTRRATGIADVDHLIGGGFPSGRLSEIAGPPSSGRTSLALALLATTTWAGEVAAVVDAADALDPASAAAAGVVLERVLWVRARNAHEAARCTERVLEAPGFGLVLLDLAAEGLPALTTAAWQRLTRSVAAATTTLVVLSRERLTGAHADLALELQPTRAHFTGTPALLEGIEIEALVVRHRAGPAQRTVSVRLRSRAA